MCVVHLRVGRKSSKTMWWNDKVEDAKEVVWKEVLGAREKRAKERCMEVYREEKKRCIYQSKKKAS